MVEEMLTLDKEQPSEELHKRFVAAFGFTPTPIDYQRGVTRSIEQEIVKRTVMGFRDSLEYHRKQLREVMDQSFPSGDLLGLREHAESQEIAIARDLGILKDLEGLATAFEYVVDRPKE